MLSLYLHLPFCRRKCAYCAFYSVVPTDDRPQRYAAALTQAIRHFGSNETRPLSTLYLGGGTPALLGEERLTGLLEAVRQFFSLSAEAEITVELNPESTHPALLKALKQAGVNRLSLGVQSLADRELRLLGRLHDRQGALRALDALFRAGFSNVSADVMYGLPGQTPASFKETLDGLLAFPLTHLSAYSLQIEEGTPLSKRGALSMDEDREEALYTLLCHTLEARGFAHYEVSNFARPGFASRHNRAYWRGTDYYGLGPGAHSFLNGVRYFYNDDLDDFCQNPIPLRHPQPIGEKDARLERVMLALRTGDGLPIAALPGLDLARYRDFSTLENGIFRLNDRGFFVSNTIIAEILAKEEQQ